MSYPVLVQKEEIKYFQFPNKEVLETQVERNKRKADLYRAMILGNGYQNKIKIVFETLEGTMEVETTVWVTTDQSVGLKGGITIPMKCIHKVIL